jgi:hypothetical protein
MLLGWEWLVVNDEVRTMLCRKDEIDCIRPCHIVPCLRLGRLKAGVVADIIISISLLSRGLWFSFSLYCNSSNEEKKI